MPVGRTQLDTGDTCRVWSVSDSVQLVGYSIDQISAFIKRYNTNYIANKNTGHAYVCMDKGMPFQIRRRIESFTAFFTFMFSLLVR